MITFKSKKHQLKIGRTSFDVFQDCVVRLYNGRIHSEDSPAVIHNDGRQRWFQNDVLHRSDGPAVIYPDGSEIWWKWGSCRWDSHED